MYRKQINIIIIFLLFSFNAFPQNSKQKTFEHIGPDEGMSSYIAPCMIQDRTGYLWFGTYNGVDRYDGHGFISYKHEPGNPNSINSGSVQALCEDKDGNIWIGTSLGLDKLDPAKGSFTHFLLHPSSTEVDFSNYVLSICEDTYGMLWIGTGDGLIIFDKATGKFTTFNHDNADTSSISNNYIHALLADKKGSLWIGTGNGLDKLDIKTSFLDSTKNSAENVNSRQGKFIHYWHDPKNQNGSISIGWDNAIEYSVPYQINSIYEDNPGMLWLCTNGEGLIEVNPKDGSFTSYKHDIKDPQSLTSITDDNIEAISQDHEGFYWIGTKYYGLNTFNKKTNRFTHYYHNDYDEGSLSINLILSINCERSGTIWITTFNGVNKINLKKFPFRQYNNVENSWDKSFGTGASVINSNDGKLWVQTSNGEILKFDPETNSFIPQFNSYRKGMNYIAEDNLGNIWIKSSTGGIYIRDKNGQVTRIKYFSGKEFNQIVYFIYTPLSNDTAWVGTLEGGIFIIKKQSKTISLIKSVNTSIKCIFKDSYGIVWAGTKDAGLIQYNESYKKFVLFKSDVNIPGSISGDLITTIYEDKKRNVWFGTNVGLNKYIRSTNSFIHYTEKDGLPNNLIFAIEGDAHGNLWFSTDKGISKLNPETGKIKNYDITYGFTSNRFYFTSCKTENGEIYFGGPGGITRFDPDSIEDNPYIPSIVITSLKIFDNPIPFGKEIKLPYDKNFLSFGFAALSYVSPERNQYAYKMEGIDRDWVYSGNTHNVSYTNLGPGEYTFKVKGSNNDGVWNEAGTSISIIISPPWWRADWAYILYGCIIVLILYGLRRYELNRAELKNRVKIDEAVLKEREETEKMKSRFFANISHEFRTPLTLILGPAEKINAQTSNDVIKDSGIIKRNSKRLLQLVNQLLDLSKLEAGKLKLEASKNNIVSFVKGIALSFESLSEEKDITLKIISQKDFIEVYFDKEKMIKILSNILSNAFKFTPQDGKITISINTKPPSFLPLVKPAYPADKEELNGGYVEIKIWDTGIGISKEEMPKLFDRFYQVDSSFSKGFEGTGIGLALTQELVELHNGNISVESEAGHWTEFILSLPLGRNHLTDEEILDGKTVKPKNLSNDEDYYLPEIIKKETENEIEANSLNDGKTIILVVEDNYDMRKYIRESLGEDYHVEEAVNGEQGIRKAVEIIPDLIISDIMMPKMNGIEMTKFLKNEEKTSHIPIIILTARSGQENKLEGLQTRADDYLTKPFDIKELQVRIENLINIRKQLQEKYSKGNYIGKQNKKKLGRLDEQFMSKVMEVIENHLGEENFSIEEFDKELGMGRVQIYRKLKALTGKSPSRYIRTIRLIKAREMIIEKQGNISEIAYSVGFAAPQYFTKCFREEFGYPPSDLINQTNQNNSFSK
jgi:signal transduction histidine kinase/ligand-binding sensor domain-containing protein/DNA-binding response OmpR family regulator